jgi:hypothetical protein
MGEEDEDRPSEDGDGAAQLGDVLDRLRRIQGRPAKRPL